MWNPPRSPGGFPILPRRFPLRLRLDLAAEARRVAEGIGNVFAQMVLTELAKRSITYELSAPSITCDQTLDPAVIDGREVRVRLFSCRHTLGPPMLIEPYIP